MKVLLTAASQHGATTEVAEAIARRLKADGLEVVCKPPQDVDSLEGFDAVICGSAVYMTQWMPAAHDFMERFAQELHKVGFFRRYERCPQACPAGSQSDWSCADAYRCEGVAFFCGTLRSFSSFAA